MKTNRVKYILIQTPMVFAGLMLTSIIIYMISSRTYTAKTCEISIINEQDVQYADLLDKNISKIESVENNGKNLNYTYTKKRIYLKDKIDTKTVTIHYLVNIWDLLLKK